MFVLRIGIAVLCYSNLEIHYSYLMLKSTMQDCIIYTNSRSRSRPTSTEQKEQMYIVLFLRCRCEFSSELSLCSDQYRCLAINLGIELLCTLISAHARRVHMTVTGLSFLIHGVYNYLYEPRCFARFPDNDQVQLLISNCLFGVISNCLFGRSYTFETKLRGLSTESEAYLIGMLM